MLTQESKNGIITTYNYDKNGNLTAESDGTQYTYDAFNQLVETDKQDGTWQQNVYDATGLRMATVENGTYTGYTYDRDNILAEYNKDDSRTTRYIRGYDLISQKKDAGETYHYLHNAHGDITKLVDSTGNVQNSYSYDAFGNTITYSEKVGNKFRYAGEQYDSITGEYYLRARYYDSSVGRFTSEDQFKGFIDDPQSMNLYTYTSNNPVMYIDPSGHCKDAISAIQNTNAALNKVLQRIQSASVFRPVVSTSPSVSYSNATSAISISSQYDIKLLKDQKVQNGDVPPPESGYVSPKNGSQWDKNKRGWVDKSGNVWVPDRLHGDHWDVQYPNGGYDNVYPDGSVRKGGGKRGKFSPAETVTPPTPCPAPPSPGNVKSGSGSVSPDPGHVAGWAIVAGTIYWVISEGSRILFPPRNLIPVP
jgi:RHS repeat-associated protein